MQERRRPSGITRLVRVAMRAVDNIFHFGIIADLAQRRRLR